MCDHIIREGDFVLGAQWNVGDFHKNGRFDPKEVEILKNTTLTDFKLYNIKKDIYQDHDISEIEPNVFNKLKNKLIRMHNEVKKEAPYIQKHEE